jgi:hypothetical protein
MILTLIDTNLMFGDLSQGTGLPATASCVALLGQETSEGTRLPDLFLTVASPHRRPAHFVSDVGVMMTLLFAMRSIHAKAVADRF